MQELNLRLGQGVALTYAQEDDNFKRLKTAIDALENAVATGGNGTVTTVGLALPNIFTVTNSPVTSAGTLTATLASQAANRFFASPNGTSGTPTFRSFLAADLGSITVPITNGGTGLAAPILNNYVLSSDGSNYQGRRLQGSTGLTITSSPGLIQFTVVPGDINITDFAGTLTSTKGGTGFTGPFAINQILLGNGSSSWTSAVLTAGSGISITNGVGTVTIANTATGVSTLNYLTGNLLMAFGAAGNFPAIATVGSDITFNIPNAGPSPIDRGLLTAADWTTFNSKVGGSGTSSYIPKFTASNNIGNSRMYDTGTKIGVNTTTPLWDLDVHSVAPATPSVIRAYGNSALASVRAESSTGGSISINTDGNISSSLNIRINNVTKGALFYTTGNTQINAGFALSGFEYWNTASNYSFSSNEVYGVILGPTSPNTMNVTLPATPMNGQEVCILCEEAKTLTLIATGSTIFGHNAGVSIDVVLTGGAVAGAASIIVKYALAANGGLGAWFITGI